MDEIAIHPASKKQIDDYLAAPAQVLALIGAPGTGKQHIAEYLASKLLQTTREGLHKDANFIYVSKPEGKQDIPIEDVRLLINKLKVKSSKKRVVLIRSAEALSHEAQNALLKTLEQPGANVHFILTVSSAAELLPTVMSRALRLVVHTISLKQAKQFYSHKSDREVTAAWSLAEGASAKIDQLLHRPEASSEGVDEAKNFVKANRYDRLLIADKLSKDRAAATAFAESLYIVVKALHHSSVKRSAGSSVRLLRARKLVNSSIEMLRNNTSPKLVLLNLATSFPI